MVILSDINGALQKIDAARFQQLGDELLRTVYEPINNIESRGSKIGEAKTIKGTPDTVFVVPNGKILIEYTTQSNKSRNLFVNKLKSDISSCLDVKKTKIPLNEIIEIVLFSNQRIAIDIQDKLRRELSAKHQHITLTVYSIDDIAAKLRDYPQLLQNYLAISTFPELIEIDSFVNRFSTSKFTYQTPLDNTYFEIDNQPISKGLELLDTNDVIIISGDAGMGKTRYAIEVATAYSYKTGAKTFIIEERNRNAREIFDNIRKDVLYLFIIDDANRTAIWDEAIEFYESTTNCKVKFIATVRDYAIKAVTDKCYKLKKCSQIQLSDIPDNLSSKILISFGITNHIWHKRINDIAGKNIRLAVMCAQIAKAGNQYDDLINIESIYNAYYKPIFEDLVSNYNNRLSVKVIAIISFYKIVDLEEDLLLEQINEIFGINKTDFVSTCHKLNELECITITDLNVAIVPDQNFGNYMFYQCFYILKEFSLSNLIEKLYYRRERLRDSIFSVWNCFHKEEVINFSQNSILNAWKNLSVLIKSEHEKCEFLIDFGGIIPSATFLYVQHLIKEQSLSSNNSSFLESNDIISILSLFSHSNESDIVTALTLMVEYLKIKPKKIGNVAKLISERWIYDDVDYVNSYKRETTIIDAIIDLSENSDIGFQFSNLILPSYFKFVYSMTQTKGRKFTFGRYPVVVTDELKANRKKIWKWIILNVSRINQLELIKNLYGDFYEVKSIAKELVSDELGFVNNYISQLNIKDDFNLCVSIVDFSTRIKNIMGKDCLKMDWSQLNPLYILDCQIRNGLDKKHSEAFEIEQNNIAQISKSKSLPELIHLVDNIEQIAKFKNITDAFRISYIIEYMITSHLNEAFVLWQYCIDSGYGFVSTRIITTYINSKHDTTDLVFFIREQKQCVKSDLLLTFISIIENPSLFFTELEFCEAVRCHTSIWCEIGYLTKKFYPIEKLSLGERSVFAAILHRIRAGHAISGTENFLYEFQQHHPSKIKLVGFAYINGLRQQNDYDSNHKLLKGILQNHPEFWIECCSKLPSFVESYHIRPYEFIWDMENYIVIIEETLLYYGTKNWIPYNEKENLYSFFCNLTGDKASEFIDMMIKKYCRNHNISSLLFEIVISSMGSKRVRHYITFITYNPDIEDFRYLNLRPQSMVGGDSFAPAIKSNLDFIKSLIEGIKAIKDIKYLEHIQYLTEKQKSWECEYNYELRCGHKRKLYDL